MNKKVKKLLKDPKLFVKDAIKNKKKSLLPIENVNGYHQYSVVSAVYNVAPYLDDYFKSFVNQTLDFEKHIFLILVDDGSPDDSAEIIKKWQKKYPNNIIYIRKENGGQASARNVGLAYVQTEWVTFIDPDDYVNNIYFENIDKLLQKDNNNDIGMIACRWKIFQEANNSFNFNHPLDFRFKDGNKVIKHKSDKKFLPSSVATTFYKMNTIKKFNIRFDESIKPNFEDGYFSAKYYIHMEYNSVLYSAKSLYIYRKRKDGDSTLDSSWENKNRFKVVLENGYLSLLEEEYIDNKIPYAIQRLIMYDMVWYFKKIINTPQSISFLNHDEKQEFKKLVYKVFKYIDKEIIMSFELAGFWFYHKVGFLGMLKNDKPNFNIIYIDDYDKIKGLVKLRYFYYESLPLEEFKVDGKYILPTYEKIRTHYFIDDVFAKERIVWLDVSNAKESIYLNLFNEDNRINLNGKSYKGQIPIADIVKFGKKEIKISAFNLPLHIKVIRKIAKSKIVKEKYKDCYVIMDRDTQADDNAEHFYRYLKENHSELNIFFILGKNSHDYKRLYEEGFNLLPFDSLSHKYALLNAKYLISSHADKYVVDYMKPKHYGDMLNYKFVFLQHGVIRDDISTWLNNKNIDAFITSMPSEYKSIAKDSKYKFTDKEIVLTGLARHDRLVQRDELTENVILIMPTWRNSLVGDLKNMSAQREVTDEFYNSDYAQHWKSVLHSSKLKELATDYNYKVVFFPHVNMSIYIDWFDAPSWIEVRTHKTDPILHKLFRRAKIMITDYSSVFFEMAILKKAILYYQFDFEYMYGGNHSSQLGYFDFEKDGFGAVSYKEEELFTNLTDVLNNNGKPKEEYLNRMITALPFRDGRNRERTLKAIKNLEKYSSVPVADFDIYYRYLSEAKKNKHKELISFYLEKLLEYNKGDKVLIKDLIENEIKSGNIQKAKELLSIHTNLNRNLKNIFIKDINEREKEFSLLSVETKVLLEKNSLVDLTKYSNILKFYDEKNWLILSDIAIFVDIDTLPQDRISYFYYMWGRSLRLVEKKEEALEKLAKSLSYNEREPNASLWEYASTLYEIYDTDEIDNQKIVSIFKENDYAIDNIDYKLIKTWFDKKYYKQVNVACALIDVENIEEKDLSYFYYMWGRILFIYNQYLKSIEKLKLSSFNTKEVQIMIAKSLVNIENWEESYMVWRSLYQKYPWYNKIETLKYLILSSIKSNINKEEIQKYTDELLITQFLTISSNDFSIIERL